RQPGYAGTDYNQALRWARDQIALSSRPLRTIHLLSDFQRAGVSGNPFDGFPPGVGVGLVEVGRPLFRSLAAPHIEATPTVVRDKDPVVARAEGRTAGRLPANNIAVRLSLEGPARVPQQVRTISVPAGVYQEVAFDVPVGKPGIYTGHVELAGEDEFPADDRR